MKYYLMPDNEVCREVGSQREGLSSAEAESRLAKNGANRLAETEKTPLWKRFLMQFTDPMIIVLLAAALISLVTSAVAGESIADVFIILFVVLLNAFLGVMQESKAEKAIDALKEMTKSKCKVLRDGAVCIIESDGLVIGDIIMLEAGDSVPADARLLEAASLKCEESALTGESVPAEKHARVIESETGEIPLGDRYNMVYTGTNVVYGRGVAVVTATGMNTEMGRIAKAITDAADEKTPLQRKLSQQGAHVCGFGNMRYRIRRRPDHGTGDKRKNAYRYLHGRSVACRRRDPGRACRRCNDSAFHRRFPHGGAERHRAEADCRGNARLHTGDMHR